MSSLRFSHPSDPGAAPGLCGDSAGRLAVVEGAPALRQSLVLLLSTRRGERVGRPDYGCELDLLAFEPNDETTAGMAIRLVADAVTACEPRAEILEIDAGADPDDPAVLRITLAYRDRRDGVEGTVTLPVDLAG